MVASFAVIRRPSYYTRGTAADYYQVGADAGGLWLRGNKCLAIERGTAVDAVAFERLCAGRSPDGKALVKGVGGKRVAGIDITLSSPKAVSVLWALGDEKLRTEIVAAEAEAVEAALQLIEREIPLARRGRDGVRRQTAVFVAAVFSHSETRPEMHADGTMMPSPQRHHHLCLPSIAERADGSWGAIDTVWVRSWKKTLGSQYRLALASALQARGFAIKFAEDDDWRWSIGGVPDEVCKFFSARRTSIEEQLESAGVTSKAAPALAAAITLRSRRDKAAGGDLKALWRGAVERLGYQPEAIVEAARRVGRNANRKLTSKREEELIATQLTAVPASLVEHQATFERRHLLEAIANALVGTTAIPEHVYKGAKHFATTGAILTLGETRDGPVHSTPEMVAIERSLVATATRLAAEHVDGPDPETVRRLGAEARLSPEQIAVAQAATTGARLVAVQGFAGAGKSTALRVVACAWQETGFKVCAGSLAWRAASTLSAELGVESRAIDSWLARAEAGQRVFDQRTVLLIDEAGLQSSPQTAKLLKHIDASGAVAVLVGDEHQHRPPGPGHALRLVRETIGVVTLETIVRQRAIWARDIVHAFARGDARAGLDALIERRLLTLHDGPKATIQALTELWDQKTGGKPTASIAVIAKTNAEVRAINAAIRQRLKDRGVVRGREVALPAVDASGNKFTLRLACGDHIRFLQRNDQLGVVNGTEATVETIRGRRKKSVARLTARIGPRQITFSTAQIADGKGRIKLAHAYGVTLFQAQGMTTETALVLGSPQFDRSSAYTAASRARSETRFFVDARQLDVALAEAGLSADDADRERARLDYLARQFARESIKTTTLDAFNLLAANEQGRQREHIKRRELSHEL